LEELQPPPLLLPLDEPLEEPLLPLEEPLPLDEPCLHEATCVVPEVQLGCAYCAAVQDATGV
jgi:hypothetical protein